MRVYQRTYPPRMCGRGHDLAKVKSAKRDDGRVKVCPECGETCPYAPCGVWWIAFRDHVGAERRLAGFKDEAQTEELADKLKVLLRARTLHEALPTEVVKWLEDLPANDVRQFCL